LSGAGEACLNGMLLGAHAGFVLGPLPQYAIVVGPGELRLLYQQQDVVAVAHHPAPPARHLVLVRTEPEVCLHAGGVGASAALRAPYGHGQWRLLRVV